MLKGAEITGFPPSFIKCQWLLYDHTHSFSLSWFFSSDSESSSDALSSLVSSSSLCSSVWTCRWSLWAAAWALAAWKKPVGNVSFIHFNNISYLVLLSLFPQCGHAVCDDKLSGGRRLFNWVNFILRLSLSPHLPWRVDIFWPLMTGNWATIKLHWCQAKLMIV